MEYHWLKIVHIIASVISVGPLALAPWIASQVVRGGEDSQGMLRTLQITVVFYNRAGWILILSGTALFYITDWHQALHAWFLLCVGLFLADNVVENRVREPAIADLANAAKHDPTWRATALRLQWGTLVQTITAGLILLLMLIRPSMG